MSLRQFLGAFCNTFHFTLKFTKLWRDFLGEKANEFLLKNLFIQKKKDQVLRKRLLSIVK